ncbi:MAG: hypothetical protein HQL09_03635 [Nitrospirae bacterium]|nr:hypothetical protein [Nitrospirota bacterium]
MSGGIGGIGGAGNMGMSQMSSVAQTNTDMTTLSIHKKKHHGEDNSFAAQLITLNTQNAHGVQSASGGGAVGMNVNKFV